MSTIKEAITTVASIMSIILWKNCFLKITNSNIYTMHQVSTTKFKTHKAEPVEQTDSSQKPYCSLHEITKLEECIVKINYI